MRCHRLLITFKKQKKKCHILTKKTKKQKRNLVHQAIVDKSNMKQVRDLLCLR